MKCLECFIVKSAIAFIVNTRIIMVLRRAHRINIMAHWHKPIQITGNSCFSVSRWDDVRKKGTGILQLKWPTTMTMVETSHDETQ